MRLEGERALDRAEVRLVVIATRIEPRAGETFDAEPPAQMIEKRREDHVQIALAHVRALEAAAREQLLSLRACDAVLALEAVEARMRGQHDAIEIKGDAANHGAASASISLHSASMPCSPHDADCRADRHPGHADPPHR